MLAPGPHGQRSEHALPGSVPARRSCLSVPGSDERKIEKSLASSADQVVLDLEDSVTVDAKDSARDAVVAVLSAQPAGATGRICVRVNPPRSPWCHRDITALASLPDPPASLVLPKVESAGDLAFVDRLLDGVEAASGRWRPVAVQALVETATGLANVSEIARASGRLEALVLGYADLVVRL